MNFLNVFRSYSRFKLKASNEIWILIFLNDKISLNYASYQYMRVWSRYARDILEGSGLLFRIWESITTPLVGNSSWIEKKKISRKYFAYSTFKLHKQDFLSINRIVKIQENHRLTINWTYNLIMHNGINIRKMNKKANYSLKYAYVDVFFANGRIRVLYSLGRRGMDLSCLVNGSC